MRSKNAHFSAGEFSQLGWKKVEAKCTPRSVYKIVIHIYCESRLNISFIKRKKIALISCRCNKCNKRSLWKRENAQNKHKSRNYFPAGKNSRRSSHQFYSLSPCHPIYTTSSMYTVVLSLGRCAVANKQDIRAMHSAHTIIVIIVFFGKLPSPNTGKFPCAIRAAERKHRALL